MHGVDTHLPVVTLLVGVVVIAAAMLRAGLERRGLPALVGYLALGLALGAVERTAGFLQENGRSIFEFLGEIGIICLLFHVGLGSKVGRLVREIRRASLVWMLQVVLCFALGYAATHWILGLSSVASVIAGLALTATSVGVAVAEWEESGLLATRDGDLLLDVAELDDISAVVAMSVVMAVLASRATGEWGPVILASALPVLLKVAAFMAVCLFFARYVERDLTRITARARGGGPTLLLITGTGFAMAAAANLFGLSAAIGAFFAGLAFSRDPVAVRADASFQALYELFVPFFFVWIGMQLDPGTLVAGAGAGSVLLVAAVVGKYAGTAWPARRLARAVRWRALAVSMIPRAEIALLVIAAGHSMGPWAVPDHLLSAMVFVSAATTLGAPLVLRRLLDHDQGREGGASAV
jgi:Kef-type K+ transport system membrane component KefB